MSGRGTTKTGSTNRHGQIVVGATGVPGTDHGQSIYVLRCSRCSNEYGANGSDLWQRRCPSCGGGLPGFEVTSSDVLPDEVDRAPLRWWDRDVRERYWLEATDRSDIGSDLRAPSADAGGSDNWRYTLFKQASVGDVVFHYDKGKTQGILGWSVIAGPSEEHPIVWAARGNYARERGAVPVEVPGYIIPLTNFTPLSEPLSLGTLRASKAMLIDLTERLRSEGKTPGYFPFELGNRDVRLLQGYAFKLPIDFVSLFPMLVDGRKASELIAGATFDPDELRVRARKARRRRRAQNDWRTPSGNDSVRSSSRTVTCFARDPEVIAWVLHQASGHCDRCAAPAPFVDDSGEPFLEVHHVRRLADGGPDRVENAVALCPNCHRQLHYGSNPTADRAALLERVPRLVDFPVVPRDRFPTQGPSPAGGARSLVSI